MSTVIGVRFKEHGKIYFFDPGELEIKKGTPVIVETARGIEYGECVSDPRDVTEEEIVSPLKPILRIAGEKDIKQAEDNRIREKEAFKICQERIRDHGLEMKLIDTEYTFDNSKILFYFTADGRVDFRELVKDLAGIFRTRIELRQVGVRDETKILGGLGICGRPLCCNSYLSDFVSVSIKMAKEQNLSLNPTKISGVCGRLMCCLANEEEVYEEQNRKLPSPGDYVTTVAGERGIVHSVDIFRETVKVLVQTGEDKELKEYVAGDIRFKKRRKKGKLELTPEELEQLRALEPEDVASLEAEINEPEEEDPTQFSIREKYADRKNNRDKDRENEDQDREKRERSGRDRDNRGRHSRPRDGQDRKNRDAERPDRRGRGAEGSEKRNQPAENSARESAAQVASDKDASDSGAPRENAGGRRPGRNRRHGNRNFVKEKRED